MSHKLLPFSDTQLTNVDWLTKTCDAPPTNKHAPAVAGPLSRIMTRCNFTGQLRVWIETMFIDNNRKWTKVNGKISKIKKDHFNLLYLNNEETPYIRIPPAEFLDTKQSLINSIATWELIQCNVSFDRLVELCGVVEADVVNNMARPMLSVKRQCDNVAFERSIGTDTL